MQQCETSVTATSLLTILAFRGDCDVNEKRLITNRLNQAGPAEHLILDFNDVAYLDSTILAAVMGLVRQRRQRHLEAPVIVASNPFIKKIFSIAGMDSKLTIAPTARDATQTILQSHLAAEWPHAASA